MVCHLSLSLSPFITHGTGTEPVMLMAPPGVVFLTLLISPVVYAVPASFLCVDLSAAFPFDGGMVSWIDIAFGNFIGLTRYDFPRPCNVYLLQVCIICSGHGLHTSLYVLLA